MINKLKRVGLIMGTAALIPAMVWAQVLESVPEKKAERKSNPYRDVYQEDEVIDFHLGSTRGGASGLVTIPTPDYNTKEKFSASYKYNSNDNDFTVNGKKVTNRKDEHITSVRFSPTPELEVSVTNLHYSRHNKQGLKSIEGKDNIVAGGMKYTATEQDVNFCVGFNYAPVSSDDINGMDIEQIENMRNVYFTLSEDITRNVSAFFNVGCAFTREQKLIVGNTTVELNRKEICYGGIGAEYKFGRGCSLFGEYKFANYRDFEAYESDATRHKVHCGARFGNKNLQVEVVGLNVTGKEPTISFGGTFGF